MAEDPWELLHDLNRAGVLHSERGRLRDFMQYTCRLLNPLLPPDAEEWLKVAEQYRQSEASSNDLERVRIAAWKFLGKDSCNFASPAVLAVRAVLCLLYPDEFEGEDAEDVWFETMRFFLDVSNDAMNCRTEQCRVLNMLFSEYF